MNKQKSLKFNFIMNSILTLSSIIFPLITFPYVSRVLLPVGTGKVSLATSVISYFVLISQLGVPIYGIRACAKVRDNIDELICTVQELFIINLLTSCIAYVCYMITIISVSKFADEKELYLVMSIFIMLNAIGIEWLYKGLEYYTYITARSIVFKLIALIALFIFVNKESDYVIYGVVSIFAVSASNVLNFINARKYIFVKPYRKRNFRTHIKAVIIFFAMSCATTIYTHLDTVMIGFINTDSDVGYYNSAIKIKQFLVSIITSLGAVLLPRSSYFIENKQFNQFQEVSKKAIHFIFFVGVPAVVYFTMFAEPSVYFLSGNEYTKSILPMQILMPTILFIGLSNLLGIQMLVPLRKEKHILISEIVGAVVNFSINLVLIPRFASIGAAIGTFVAEATVLVYQIVILRNLVGDFFIKIRYWKLIIACSLGAVLSSFVYKLHYTYFFILCLSAIIFFGIYVGICVLLKEKFVISILKEINMKVVNRK